MVNAFDDVPHKERQQGHWLARNDQQKPIAWFRCFKNQKKLLSKEISWQQQLAEELHKSIKSNFTRRHIIVDHIDETWSADLVDMQSFNKWNKGHKYLLMVIDVFTIYGQKNPLKDKVKL